jgi:hypothetical protein
MNLSKVLININSLGDLEDYKKIGITNFLFALKDYSIGYKEFNLEDIPTDSYILINRVLDTKGIDGIKSIKDKLLNYKGIIFEDLGVYNIFKNEDIELIWAQAHFGTNTESINYWLTKCESALLSNEITKEEITDIVNDSIKPVVLNVFGKNMIMYSRRTLLTNFNKYNELDDVNDVVLDETHTKNKFYAHETENGTAIFNNDYFNYIEFSKSLDDSKIKYYLVYNLDLSVNDIKDILEGKPYGNDGFLNKKTVYRMSEYTDR